MNATPASPSIPSAAERRPPAWLWVALTAVVGVAAVLTLWQGLFDGMWFTWLGLFAVLETHAILSEAEGDTLSERIRVWFRTKTQAGRIGFVAVMLGLLAWFIPHILV